MANSSDPVEPPNEADTAPTSTARLPRNVRLLAAASLLNDVASEAMFPLLPELLRSLGATRLHLGLIEGLADATASLLKLWTGGWSDRWGARRGFVLAGYGLSAIAKPLAALATTATGVLAVRLGDRLGKGLRTSARDALLVDSTPEVMRGRAFGFHRAMDHLGAAIGPLLAFAFLWCWPGAIRALFAWTVVPGVAVLLLLGWGLQATIPRSAAASESVSPGVLSNRRFRGLLLAIGLFTLGNSTDAFLLARAQELGWPAAWLPLLWAGFHVLKSAGSLAGGRRVDLLGARGSMLMGWLLYALVYLGFAGARTPAQVAVLFVIYAGFYALAEPAEKTLVAQLAPEGERGAAFGWFHLVVGLTTLPASLVFGAWYEWVGPWAAFTWGATLAGLAAALAWWVLPAERPVRAL